MVSCLLKSGANAGSSRSWHAMGSCRKHGVVRDDSIITLGGIVGAVGKTGLAESGNFSLEDLDIRWIGGCMARTGSKGTRVDGFLED